MGILCLDLENTINWPSQHIRTQLEWFYKEDWGNMSPTVCLYPGWSLIPTHGPLLSFSLSLSLSFLARP